MKRDDVKVGMVVRFKTYPMDLAIVTKRTDAKGLVGVKYDRTWKPGYVRVTDLRLLTKREKGEG